MGWYADMSSMVQYTMTGGFDASGLAIVTIDSPRFILAVDPLAALMEFAMSPFKKSSEGEETAEVEQKEITQDSTRKSNALAFRIEIVDSTVIVLANDSDARSQAIQLNIKEVLLSQQHVMALKLDNLGMSFGRMDRPNDRVKFLDDLNVALSLDTRQRGPNQMTSFEIDIPDPVIFRASPSDIMLIIDIVNKATAAATRARAPEGESEATLKQRRRSSLVTDGVLDSASLGSTVAVAKSSTRRTSVSARRKYSLDKSKVLVSKEQVSQMSSHKQCQD